MKHLLILSFDLVREGEPLKSFSIASLLAYLKQDPRYGQELYADHESFNLLAQKEIGVEEIVQRIVSRYDLEKVDFLAIGVYIWAEYLIHPLIRELRRAGFRNTVILGGYQISYSDFAELKKDYPEGQIFIMGYGEQSLRKAITEHIGEGVLREEVDFASLPSVYLTGEIPLPMGQPMVRFETKRGCPYQCHFCAHRDLGHNKVYLHSLDKVFQELAFFKEKGVKKINILDPVFNVGDYLTILEEIHRIDLDSLIALQVRFEKIVGERGKRFLELCSQLQVHLEFGVQTIHENEYRQINRPNNLTLIQETIQKLGECHISYEVSLIYGLPHQTLTSFQTGVHFLQNLGCQKIKAFPLILLKGTELFALRQTWNLREKILGDFHLPLVVSSDSFSEDDWYQMKALADSLGENGRV